MIGSKAASAESKSRPRVPRVCRTALRPPGTYCSAGDLIARGREIAECANMHRLPTMFGFRENSEVRSFIVSAARVADISPRTALFVDRILKGTRPSKLPIEQPTIFDLIDNLKTAKIICLTLPPTLPAQVCEMIA